MVTGEIDAQLCLAAALALSLTACAATVPGSAGPIAAQTAHKVEWVSDPESHSGLPLAVTLSGDGVFLVNADLPPGTYQTSGSREEEPCEWRTSMLAPSGMRTTGHSSHGAVVQLTTIAATDLLFETSGCSPWRLIR